MTVPAAPPARCRTLLAAAVALTVAGPGQAQTGGDTAALACRGDPPDAAVQAGLLASVGWTPAGPEAVRTAALSRAMTRVYGGDLEMGTVEERGLDLIGEALKGQHAAATADAAAGQVLEAPDGTVVWLQGVTVGEDRMLDCVIAGPAAANATASGLLATADRRATLSHAALAAVGGPADGGGWLLQTAIQPDPDAFAARFDRHPTPNIVLLQVLRRRDTTQ